MAVCGRGQFRVHRFRLPIDLPAVKNGNGSNIRTGEEGGNADCVVLPSPPSHSFSLSLCLIPFVAHSLAASLFALRLRGEGSIAPPLINTSFDLLSRRTEDGGLRRSKIPKRPRERVSE